MRKYPCLEINLKKIRQNIISAKEKCDKYNVKIAGVIKGSCSDVRIAQVCEDEGIEHIASSRIGQLKKLKEANIKTPLFLIRNPMMFELEDLVKYADLSVQSEIETIKLVNKIAKEKGITHGIILMKDIGDLREGFWNEEEILEVALMIENEMPNLELLGVGTNLSCYGAVEATPQKLMELVEIAEKIEKAIGRKLKYISGGATSSFPRVLEGTLPERINHLRLGETVFICKDQARLRGYDLSFMNDDIFTLKAEIIEIKVKPSLPQGESILDSAGNRPVFKDRGIMKRGILAIGQADYGSYMYGDTTALMPIDKGVELIGASSDHTIVNLTNAEKDYKVGDVLSFDVWYTPVLHTSCKEDIRIEYVE